MTRAIRLSRCPACRSTALARRAFVSQRAFLSEPGYAHSRCRACGTYFVDPQPTDEALAGFYRSKRMEGKLERSMALDSARRVLDPARRDYFWDNRIAPIHSRLRRRAKVYDAGCGVGAFVHAMRREGFDCSGSDLSRASVEAGRRVLRLPSRAISVGGVDDFPGDGYELISAWTIIEHLREPESFLRLASAKLAPKGWLIVEFPTVDSLMFDHFGKDFYWVMPPYHLHLFSLKGMTSLLRRSGFRVDEVRPMRSNWYWFDLIARRAGVSPAGQERLKSKEREFVLALDRLLDDVAYSVGRPSVVQIIARKG